MVSGTETRVFRSNPEDSPARGVIDPAGADYLLFAVTHNIAARDTTVALEIRGTHSTPTPTNTNTPTPTNTNTPTPTPVPAWPGGGTGTDAANAYVIRNQDLRETLNIRPYVQCQDQSNCSDLATWFRYDPVAITPGSELQTTLAFNSRRHQLEIRTLDSSNNILQRVTSRQVGSGVGTITVQIDSSHNDAHWVAVIVYHKNRLADRNITLKLDVVPPFINDSDTGTGQSNDPWEITSAGRNDITPLLRYEADGRFTTYFNFRGVSTGETWDIDLIPRENNISHDLWWKCYQGSRILTSGNAGNGTGTRSVSIPIPAGCDRLRLEPEHRSQTADTQVILWVRETTPTPTPTPTPTNTNTPTPTNTNTPTPTPTNTNTPTPTNTPTDTPTYTPTPTPTKTNTPTPTPTKTNTPTPTKTHTPTLTPVPAWPGGGTGGDPYILPGPNGSARIDPYTHPRWTWFQATLPDDSYGFSGFSVTLRGSRPLAHDIYIQSFGRDWSTPVGGRASCLRYTLPVSCANGYAGWRYLIGINHVSSQPDGTLTLEWHGGVIQATPTPTNTPTPTLTPTLTNTPTPTPTIPTPRRLRLRWFPSGRMAAREPKPTHG